MARGKHHAQVLTWFDITNSNDSFPTSDPDLYHIKILAEGDSWFTLAGIPTSNILFNLRFHEPTLIVNIAYPGDTMVHMSKLSDNADLKQALGKDGLEWNAILLSGGGNDLVDHAHDILLARNERAQEKMPSMDGYVSKQKYDNLLSEIKQGYIKIAQLRDQANGNANNRPIITYTYAYATPRNSPARFFGFGVKGPWIYPAFIDKEIPKSDWLALSDYLLDRLAEGHIALQNEIDHFHVVDTRDKLIRSALATTGDDADWLNEFHPNGDGYEKLAKAIEPVLYKMI